MPSDLSKPVRTLISDLTGGKLSKREAAQLANQMVSDPTSVAKTHRLTSATTETDLMVLGAIVGASLDSSTQPAPRHVPAGTLNCTLISGTHSCTYSGSHSAIGCTAEQLSTDEAADDDSDGVPDYIEQWADQADNSWNYYRNTLGMIPTSDVVNISINYDLAEIRPFDVPNKPYLCGSWPDATIRCGNDVPSADLDWLVPHEMFHQFQWRYLSPTLLLSFPLVVASVYNINPWMESTANWAVSHYAADILAAGKTQSGAEVDWLPVFHSDVANGLVASGTSTSGAISGPRAYGAAPVVEFFTQRTSNDFVRESFVALNPFYLDGYSQINDALWENSSSLNDLINPLWLAVYTMCDTHSSSEWWHLEGGIVATWCSRFETPGRPSQFSASISSPGEIAYELVPGGVGFVDFDLSVGPGASGALLSLTFDDSVSVDEEVNLWAWKDTPGGETCNVDQRRRYGSETTTLEVLIPGDCGHATLAMVNHGSDLRGSATTYRVSWRGQPAGAVIGNGVLKLGVNADGSLGLGVSLREEVCRSAVARSTVLPPVGVGLIDEAAEFDAIRDAWHQTCRRPDIGEGRSVADPNSTWRESPRRGSISFTEVPASAWMSSRVSNTPPARPPRSSAWMTATGWSSIGHRPPTRGCIGWT
nr:hypothetical protein [Propionicimonas sp.]